MFIAFFIKIFGFIFAFALVATLVIFAIVQIMHYHERVERDARCGECRYYKGSINRTDYNCGARTDHDVKEGQIACKLFKDKEEVQPTPVNTEPEVPYGAGSGSSSN